jgi:hypothetical protein
VDGIYRGGTTMIPEDRLEPERKEQRDFHRGMHRDALRGLGRINVVNRSVAIMWAEFAAGAHCGLVRATISHHWPQRWLLVWRQH